MSAPVEVLDRLQAQRGLPSLWAEIDKLRQVVADLGPDEDEEAPPRPALTLIQGGRAE